MSKVCLAVSYKRSTISKKMVGGSRSRIYFIPLEVIACLALGSWFVFFIKYLAPSTYSFILTRILHIYFPLNFRHFRHLLF